MKLMYLINLRAKTITRWEEFTSDVIRICQVDSVTIERETLTIHTRNGNDIEVGTDCLVYRPKRRKTKPVPKPGKVPPVAEQTKS